MDADHSQAVSRSVDEWIFAWCALSQRARRWQTLLDQTLQPHGLASMALLVLWRTGHAAPPGISQAELSRELSVSAAQICGVVETLQTDSLLQMARLPGDRRRLICSLTPLGCKLLDQIVGELGPFAERCLREEDRPDDRTTLLRIHPLLAPPQEEAA